MGVELCPSRSRGASVWPAWEGVCVWSGLQHLHRTVLAELPYHQLIGAVVQVWFKTSIDPKKTNLLNANKITLPLLTPPHLANPAPNLKKSAGEPPKDLIHSHSGFTLASGIRLGCCWVLSSLWSITRHKTYCPLPGHSTPLPSTAALILGRVLQQWILFWNWKWRHF